MTKLENIQLFNDLNEVSKKYNYSNLNDTDKIDNKKLQETIILYKNKLNDIKSRANFISKQVREECKNANSKQIYSTSIEFNNFAKNKCECIINKNTCSESLPVKAVLHCTLDELLLVNNSIREKEFLKDKPTYFYIYEKTVLNAFLNFLALKDMDIDKDKIECLSQAILSQIQCLSLISL